MVTRKAALDHFRLNVTAQAELQAQPSLRNLPLRLVVLPDDVAQTAGLPCQQDVQLRAGAARLRLGKVHRDAEPRGARLLKRGREDGHLAAGLGRGNGAMSADALEMGLNGRGSRTKGRLGSPPRSPSQSPSRSSRKSGGMGGFLYGASNLCSLLISPIWVQTFVMTFLGEWGDRSQIATIAMAAGQDYWWVTLGAAVGHAICTGVAVIGGRAIAGRVSMKVVTIGGAVAFLAFGLIYFVESFYA
ncbi:hypothetical protein NLG97_g6250 [Lecanicillium saksenae]|uniref:Uncharacterized protein n=1 Tax=Lecanicillium saksenae TaxID=468837 RepID=A0ACC1QRU1_9HYPO|nr:hypothetical protein NLG97_g6250 [Lecanicillium saksenae]